MSHVIFDIVTDCVASTIEEAYEIDIIVVSIADGESNIITDYDPDYKLNPTALPAIRSISS